MKNYGVNDYYNYMNNNYNQPLYNQQSFNNMNKKSSKLFDPYVGFISGNMFPDLYNAYKLSNPLDIEPMNEQAELLTYIDALCFACLDLNLYLDLYPDDKSAIELFNRYREEKKNLEKEYESKYGPLFISSDALNTFPWAWDNSPWPWQNK